MSNERIGELSLTADVDLAPTDKGGRNRPVYRGYRPALWFGETSLSGDPALHSVVIDFEGEPIAPGSRRAVSLSPVAFETWPPLRKGMPFDVYDGQKQVGRGTVRSTVSVESALPQLQQTLNAVFEDWVVDRFHEHPVRMVSDGDSPDFSASFVDSDGNPYKLIVNVVARAPKPSDVKRAQQLMAATGAALALLVTWDEPNAQTLRAIYKVGLARLAAWKPIPAVRVVTARDLARSDFQILPAEALLTGIELAAA